ncbi:hypothetical protein Athai_33440 [Actinocatenispora thailandica]|uniref:Proline dehydrogenase n=1 Tax=Actinocatenispora thailandica TaxID=227318 RepID=A0A7R7HXK9_9ACTN|nr:2Fe-2S iron-sulfur cluster-binding protein [Actinocatenispora thailandica]BCJ35841.1 hypothetical protein Athai_33440 [Actinocatenispora thailandica]
MTDDDTARGPYRVVDDPVEPTAEPIGEIVVDGTAVPLRAGETVGAALLAAGRVGWDDGRAAVFCGIGVCYGCLVTVNGSPNIRACRYVARPGDTVTTARDGGAR